MGCLNYITTTAFPVIKIVRNNATEKPEQSSNLIKIMYLGGII